MKTDFAISCRSVVELFISWFSTCILQNVCELCHLTEGIWLFLTVCISAYTKVFLYLHDILLTKLQISDKLEVLKSKAAVIFHDGKYGNLKYEVCYQTPVQCIPLLNIIMFFHFLGLTITTGGCSNPVGEAEEITWKWRWIRLPYATQFSFDHPLHVLRNSFWSHGFLLVKPAHHFCKRLFHVQATSWSPVTSCHNHGHFVGSRNAKSGPQQGRAGIVLATVNCLVLTPVEHC